MMHSGLPADSILGESLRRFARNSARPSVDLQRERLVEALPELAGLQNVQQDPRWHPEGDVLTHSLLAADAAAAICDGLGLVRDRREVVVLASLFHDVGKPATTHMELGRFASPGHAELGEEIVLAMGARLRWPASMTTAIAGLTRHHMAHLSVQGDPSRRAVARLSKRLLAAGTSITEWSILVEADGAARGGGATANRAAPWMRVASQL